MRFIKYLQQCFLLIFIIAMMLQACTNDKQETSRVRDNFNDGWKFYLSDKDYSEAEIDDSEWRMLSLPHDWSIEGEFNIENPATVGGGALPGGVGWYRKHFRLPERDSLRNIFIHFDGVYWNSEVYLNGHHLGSRPNGYIGFRYELSPYLKYGDEVNILSVKVDNSEQPNSRWYSGSGIYRNVWIIKTSQVYIDQWATFVTTPEVSDETAIIEISTSILNSSSSDEDLIVEMSIMSGENQEIVSKREELKMTANSVKELAWELEVEDPNLWSLDDPLLYRLELSVTEKGKLIDNESVIFGIRSFSFDGRKGFILNNEPLKILGVCNHHDLGCMGSAVNLRAIERQLEILKGMGCNAIRTAHNPPAPELLDLCDQMGFVVMDETFDMWKMQKSPHDYSHYWDEWHVRDLTDHILRDRNHPSVFIWSIGNEILEQWDTTGIEMTRELAGIVNSLDQSRPIVTGNNSPDPGNALLKADVMDLIGYNYHHEDFEDFPETFPGKSFIATETTSGLMTRGHYDMPSDSIRRWPYRWDIPFTDGNADHTVSSYDNVSAPWGSTHEETWKIIKNHDYLAGMFIWTGFDYLGEPTPYAWPSRSSYFGVIDLAGFPKDIYYMYKSEWTDEPVLHVFPHWNWEDGQEIDIWAYTNCETVELFLNGESMGARENADSVFHLAWNLKFAPGELKAVGIMGDGEVLERVVTTAGSPARLVLEADRSSIQADGNDLSFITVSVLDEAGTFVPDAEDMVSFLVEGPAEIIGVDNGNQVSHEPFKANYRKAFHGKCLLVLRSKNEEGEVSIIARAEGLEEARMVINTRK